MRIKPFVLACALVLVPSLTSFGAFSVLINSNGGPKYIDTDGSDLSGSIIRAGFFTADPTAAIATAINNGGFDALNSIFTAFGEDTETTLDGSFLGQGWEGVSAAFINDIAGPGHVNGQVTNVDNNYAGGNGQQLAIWVINSDSLENATAFGVFSSGAPTWRVPALGSANLNTINIQQDGASSVLAGSITDNGLQLQRIIPEPSVAAFLGLGSLLVLRRRK